MRDYLAWHDDYDLPGSRLHLRLLVVQDLVAAALDSMPPGPIRVTSMCAGQGRDVLTVARRHRRGPDLEGVLVELDPRNVEVARQYLAEHGVTSIEVVQADAGLADTYANVGRADLVLACGIFGNISDDDMRGTVARIPQLCRPGAWVIWTRYPRDERVVADIEDEFTSAGFMPQALVSNDDCRPGVGAARLAIEPPDLELGRTLFTFTR